MSEIVTCRRWWVAVFLPWRPGKERKLVSRERETETDELFLDQLFPTLSVSSPPSPMLIINMPILLVFGQGECLLWGWGAGGNLCPKLATLWRIKENVYLNSWSWKFFWCLQSHPKKKPIGTLITCYIFFTSILLFAPLHKYTTLTRFLVWYSGIVRMPAPSQRPQHAWIPLFFKTTSTPAWMYKPTKQTHKCQLVILMSNVYRFLQINSQIL